MTNIEKLHCQLFGDFLSPVGVYRENCEVRSDCLNNRKNKGSCSLSANKQMLDPKDLNKSNSKKAAAIKKSENRLTFKKSKRIFGVFYIFTLTNIKRVFFSLNRVPKNRAKGTKKSGIEANSSPKPLNIVYFIKMIGGYFEAKLMKNSKMSRFNCLQKGAKKSGMRLNEAKVWAKGTKKSGKGVVFRDIKNIRGTTFGGALIGVGNDG
jgi:hypothetical protein